MDERVKRRGFFLIYALWVMLILSLFCVGLAYRTYISAKKTKLLLNRTRAFYLAASGVTLARRVIDQDDSSAVDHIGEEWALLGSGGELSGETGGFAEEISFSFPKREGRLSVKIEDESSRLDINAHARESAAGGSLDESVLRQVFDARGTLGVRTGWGSQDPPGTYPA